LKARVLTALIAIPIVLGAVFYTHPLPFLALEIVVFGAACLEYFRMVGETRRWMLAVAVLGFTALSALWMFAAPRQGFLSPLVGAEGAAAFAVLLVAEAAAVASIWLRVRKASKSNAYSTLFEALGWIGAPLIALFLIRSTELQAQWRFNTGVLLVLIPVWAGDIAGIFVGMGIGRHKLAPQISPKKTVEGAVGNFVFALVSGAAVSGFLQLPLWIGVVCGAIASLFGQIGDLFESWVKRRADIKDSGTLLPGHGGLLDRIDSLLFAAIPVALFLALGLR